MSLSKKIDEFLSLNGPAALVIREHLTPVEGEDGVLFPPTYAAQKSGEPGGYNIDTDAQGQSICLIDSVGAQANRIEPMFEEEPYSSLVPQIVVKAGEKEVSIFEAGHRAGDALVRCSELQQTLQDAFKSVLKGDAEPLAKIAPTSLVFGVWDSRDTQAKLPRIIGSTIRAYDVSRLKRSAQFNPATEYVNEGLLPEPADKTAKDAFAERGFIHVPATGSHGGIIAHGGIRRDATLALTAIRRLFAGKDDAKTLKLRRYILGLSLVAFTKNPAGDLRQGCNLVLDPSKPREFVEVLPTGERKPVTFTHEDALAFAQQAAHDFGVGESRVVPFDKQRALKDVSPKDKEEKKSKPKAAKS
ncbi:CRISPR-associated protein, GSU0053 family [Planctopirus limnophila DSM 3776]|uniref:CRISPR-associated protein, GSU0053 family n=1 Tax=Planctopirus limnophila (strain ATCC 43296 / DSM 3776 / IFAM 1008 / Mu 290) TaxID=521674 RepID=D5STD5_PLAL2|nr:type I-U CRISPR-associated RAMP protein Csb1/Cas7u [Planctopirus limnophila]ADG68964.1 CRISPR-associated protein, GSU0053 family [Planctopirus limnophila DSM 3776]